MNIKHIALAIGAAFGFGAAVPADAQFFFQPPNLRGDTVRGDEPGIGLPLPGATPAEVKAGLVWNMRAALNVAALQCQFEPTLLTLPNYNAILTDHKDELQKAFDVLTAYFVRTTGSKKAGQDALDRFGTRTYSGFSTVGAQYTFCQTAGSISHDAVFARRGEFAEVAGRRMREMRNSLVRSGEQRFPGRTVPAPNGLPTLEERCWKKEQFDVRKCSLAPNGLVATR